jgi:hypothetical protein
MPPDDPVVTSLEHMAELSADLDISPQVYARFAARCPSSAALMSHMDSYTLGRMMQDVLMLLMTPPDGIDQHYLSFEVSSHRAYGVTAEMFPPLLEAVRDTLREHLGAAWSHESDTAWNERIVALAEQIESAGPG